MSWSEAFQRALKGVISLAVIYIVGTILTVIGAALIISGLDTYDNDIALVILGLPIGLAGLIIILLGGFAVLIKILTDSIMDHTR